MDKPFDFIFIDTSVFRQSSFFQKDGSVDRLFELANKGFVRILMPTITEKEWLKHFEQGVRIKFDEIERKSRLLGLDETRVFQEKYDGISKEYDTLVKKSFKNHLDDAKVIRLGLDYPSDSLKTIFEKYFAKEKPFGTDGKKSEFPDAFVLSSLEKYATKHDIDKIVVFACDGDMKDYVSPVLEVGDATEFLNEIVTVKMPAYLKEETEKVEKDIARLYQYIGSKPSSLLDQIQCKVEEFLTDVSNYEERFNYIDIDEAYVDELNLNSSVKDMEIHSIEDEVMTALFFVDVDASIRVHSFDEEESIWDSEDKRYITKEFKTTVLNISSTVTVTIGFNRAIWVLDNEHISEITDIDVNSLQDAINDDGWGYDAFGMGAMSKQAQAAQTMRRAQELFQMPSNIQEAIATITTMQSLPQYSTPAFIKQIYEFQEATEKMSESIKQIQQKVIPTQQALLKFEVESKKDIKE